MTNGAACAQDNLLTQKECVYDVEVFLQEMSDFVIFLRIVFNRKESRNTERPRSMHVAVAQKLSSL